MYQRRVYPLVGLLCLQSSVIASSGRAPTTSTPFIRFTCARSTPAILQIRGGNEDVVEVEEDVDLNPTSTAKGEEDVSFEEKVQAAMRKFGLQSQTPSPSTSEEASSNCEGGVCTAPSASTTTTDEEPAPEPQNVEEMAKKMAEDFDIDESMAMSALHATATVAPNSSSDSLEKSTSYIFNEEKAREIIQYELDAVKQKVPEDSEEVQELIDEGYESSMVKRALALTDMNIDDARAILIAEKEDEEYELEQMQKQKEDAEKAAAAPPMKTISVNSNFDPTVAGNAEASASATPPLPTASSPASKPSGKPEIYSCTTAEIQSLILESPIPVLLDVYADWCGPCKQLTPALEDMCRKSNGLFRLVKLNADEEKGVVNSVLGVTGYPTLFGIRNGKIINQSVGAPRSEDAFRAFMMKMVSGNDDEGEFEEMNLKLVKMAGTAALPFSQRERMQTMTQRNLSNLLSDDCKQDMHKAEKNVKMVRILLSKVISSPSDLKFRKVNLSHPALQNVKNSPSCAKILKTAGFQKSASDDFVYTLKESQSVINIAPLMVVRDCIDKWMDVNRYEIAKAARKAKEDRDRLTLNLEKEEEENEDVSDVEEEEVEEVDPNLCKLKLRLDGKKKNHDMEFDGDELLGDVMDAMMEKLKQDVEQETQLICASKRLVIKSSDDAMMQKSLKEVGIFPAASVVLKPIQTTVATEDDEENDEAAEPRRSSIAERAKAKKKKTGSHTMQSIGIYAKDDNAKGELIDGGGGVWYEHDVTDDEEEPAPEEKEDSEDSEE